MDYQGHAVLQTGAGGIHVNAQHLAQQRLRVLTIAEGIAAIAAISQAEIEEAIWSKCQLPSLVVGEISNLVHCEQDSFAGRIRLVRIAGGSQVFDNDRLNLA